VSPADVAALLAAGLIRPVRRTADGRVTEYALTHAGRTLGTRRPTPTTMPPAAAEAEGVEAFEAAIATVGEADARLANLARAHRLDR
jgi:hypothetical protein